MFESISDLFSGEYTERNKVFGFVALIMIVLSVSTAAFFFLAAGGAGGEDVSDTRWLGWMAIMTIGALFTFAFGAKVEYEDLGREADALLTGILAGVGLVAFQMFYGIATNNYDVFIHAAVRDNVILALMAGVAEELFFRGFIQEMFERLFHSFVLAVIPASLIFALFHYPALGVNMDAFIILFLGGIFLGTLYATTKNIGACIVAHTINNTFATWGGVSTLLGEFWWIIAGPIVIVIIAIAYMALTSVKVRIME